MKLGETELDRAYEDLIDDQVSLHHAQQELEQAEMWRNKMADRVKSSQERIKRLKLEEDYVPE